MILVLPISTSLLKDLFRTKNDAGLYFSTKLRIDLVYFGTLKSENLHSIPIIFLPFLKTKSTSAPSFVRQKFIENGPLPFSLFFNSRKTYALPFPT